MKPGGERTPRLRSGSRREQAAGRLRLSCLRCQKRKIRCDRSFPCCVNCNKAGAECVDGESAKLRGLPRAYVKSLKDRISWLESIISSRCPDIDLAHQGPVVEQEPKAMGDASQQLSGVTEGDISLNQFDVDLSGEGDSSLNFQEPPHSVLASSPPQQIGRQPAISGAPINEPSPAFSSGTGLSHEVGLVSLGASHDLKYIGPSSGFVLSKLMLVAAKGAAQTTQAMSNYSPLLDPELIQLLDQEDKKPTPISKNHAVRLCQTYFDIIHPQYPFLHKPSFMNYLDQASNNTDRNPVASFQAYMVLAISAILISRLHRISLPADKYYTSAMTYFEKIQVEGSLQGLQCLLLLLIFAIHNPSVKLNTWYLNYHCIASVLDLGLQRNIRMESGLSRLEQEMRTRIFWVVFTLDRTIATMMGRPIGLRDEACELRLPLELSDESLQVPGLDPPPLAMIPNHMSYAIHLFKLARINSEIKYVANSINRETPNYAYPSIIDIKVWQLGILAQLDQWAAEIPSSSSQSSSGGGGGGGGGEQQQQQQQPEYTETMCMLRYHEIRMLLLRPSPAIPGPDTEMLRRCFASAEESVRLHNVLYKGNRLVHSWSTFHSLVLSLITMYYCIFAVPDLAQTIHVANFAGSIRAGLNVLSAVGEHWTGAKTSRNLLDELSGPIINWLMRRPLLRGSIIEPHAASSSSSSAAAMAAEPSRMETAAAGADQLSIPTSPMLQGSFDNGGSWVASLATFGDLMDGRSFAEQYETTDYPDVDAIMLSLLEGFQPLPMQELG